MNAKILIIDDNPDVSKALKVLCKINDIECSSALSPEEGFEKLTQEYFDLVIQDMNFSADTTSGEEGVELFKSIRQSYPDIPIILITAWTNLQTAVELVKQGAADYLAKPWDDEKLLISIKNLIELNELHEEKRSRASKLEKQRQELQQKYDLCGIQYRSEAMLHLIQVATQVAHSDVPILITGPNGSGKEKIAEIIQANSSCKKGPFIKVNVGALPKDLMEAELFGAEAGAYTGASKRRIGRFEAAHNGTLFLDEIGNLSLEGQMKLLRVIQTGEYERLGSTETRRAKVRIISATNADLAKAIEDETFREDLYYRLNVIELNLPPLVERKEDIASLARLFLEDGYCLEKQAYQALTQYHWPGNVRELENVIKRACLLCQNNTITTQDLNLKITTRNSKIHSEEITADMLRNAVHDAGGVISDAAKLLGISRSAFYRRIKKFDIDIN